MHRKQLERFIGWFDSYVAGFYGDDAYVNANLKLKEDHTKRVRREINDLTDQLDLGENDRLLAETVAIFHDVGRFRQFVEYRTYCDPRSINHNLLAVEILRQNNILDILQEGERKIIATAVELHGTKKLVDDLRAEVALHAKLIRDADKLDIYYVSLKYQKEYRANPVKFMLETEFPNEPRCTEKVFLSVINGELVDYADLHTLNDFRLMQLGWVFDVNFIPTFERIRQRGYLEETCTYLTCTDKIEKVKKVVLDHVDLKISGS